jgi:hypothetical protein
VYVKLLPIHYFALICPFYVFIYFFNENDVWISLIINVGDIW